MAKMTDINEHIQEMIKAGSTLVVEDLEEHCGYTRFSNVLLRNPDISELDKIVYGLIRSFAYGDKVNAFPGQDRLAQYIGKRRETVNVSLNRLKNHGLIDWIRRGMGETNIYVIKKIPEQMILDYINREAEIENQANNKKTLASLMKDRSLSKSSGNLQNTDVSPGAHQSTNPVNSTDVCLDTHHDVSLDAHPSINPDKSTDVRLDTHQTDVSLDTHHDVRPDAHKEYKYKNTSIKIKRTTTTEDYLTKKEEQVDLNPGFELDKADPPSLVSGDNVVVVNNLEPDWRLIRSHLRVGDTVSLQREAFALGIDRPEFILTKKAQLSVDEQAIYLVEQWVGKKSQDFSSETNPNKDNKIPNTKTDEEYPFEKIYNPDSDDHDTTPQGEEKNNQEHKPDPEWEPRWVEVFNKLDKEWSESNIGACIITIIHPYRTSIKDTGNLGVLSKTVREEYNSKQLIRVLRELVRQLKNGLIIKKNLATWLARLFKTPIASVKGQEAEGNKKKILMRSMYS